MATYLENLIAARDAAAEKLAAISTSAVAGTNEPGSRPNASGANTLNDSEYYERWKNAVDDLNRQIDEATAREPYTRESRGVV